MFNSALSKAITYFVMFHHIRSCKKAKDFVNKTVIKHCCGVKNDDNYSKLF